MLNNDPHVIMRDMVPVAVAVDVESAHKHAEELLPPRFDHLDREWTESGKLFVLKPDAYVTVDGTSVPVRIWTGWEARPVMQAEVS